MIDLIKGILIRYADRFSLNLVIRLNPKHIFDVFLLISF